VLGGVGVLVVGVVVVVVVGVTYLVSAAGVRRRH